MRAALYSRVSTSTQDCALQLEALREYCHARGWTAQEYVDHGVSGAKASRPALDRLMADAQARRIDVVCVYKLDRFGRSVSQVLGNIQALERAGVRFLATTQPIDTDASNPLSRFLLAILAAVGELDREMIRERVKDGITRYRAQYAQGKPASKSGKNLAIGGQAKVFDRARARQLRAEGYSLRDISRSVGVSPETVRKALAA